jgi:hypothetical protein
MTQSLRAFPKALAYSVQSTFDPMVSISFENPMSHREAADAFHPPKRD